MTVTRAASAILLLSLCAATPPAPPAPRTQPLAKTPAPWKLVWSDEFNTSTAPDPRKWNVRDNSRPNYDGGINHYDPAEVRVTKDTLAIRSRPVAGKGGKTLYSSGRVDTLGKFSFLYGKIEIRAKLPGGQGLWPALWLLPDNGAWPPEIDVAELLGHAPNRVFMTNHYGSRRKRSFDQDSYIGPDFTAGYHTFTFEWEPHLLRWYVDGVKRKVLTTNIPAVPMYLIMNTSVGGDWPGPPTKSTPFPQYLQIDYVRIYQRQW